MAEDGSSCRPADPAALAGCLEVDDGTCIGGRTAGGGDVDGCICAAGICIAGDVAADPEACADSAARACCDAEVGRNCPGSQPPAREWGSIVLSDGVELHYTLIRPASEGPFPVGAIPWQDLPRIFD